MKQYFLFLFISVSLSAWSQGYEISFVVKGAENSNVELGYYFADKQYVQAKGKTDSKGRVSFSGKEELFPGLFMLIIPDKKHHFDFLVDDNQKFEIRADVTSPKLMAKGSKVNQVFFDYQNFMINLNPKMTEAVALRDSLKKTQPESEALAKAEKEVAELDEQISGRWKKVVEDNPDLIIAPLLKALNGPKPYQGREGDYFFENIDFSKHFFLRTPVLRETIMRVLAFNLNKKRPPADLIHECDRLLAKAEANDKVFEYTFNYILNFFNTFQRTGMNEVFVHLVENYVSKGKTPWFKDEHVLEIKERAKVLRSNFIGETAIDLQMKNFADEFVSLYDIDSKFTIVYFWSIMCGHCKETTPLVKKLYDEVADPTALEVFAVCTDDRKDDAEKYILENKYNQWINVMDPKNESGFRERYNVYSTPLLYLLDKNKKIVSKRLGPDQVKELVDQLLLQKEKFK